jgi:Rrf2 family protein
MLSRRTLSAIAVVLDLAQLARGKPLPAKALAEKHALPPRQFETVLQDLVRAGILKGVRGPRGGYELARERRRISLADIVRAIDERSREDGAEPDSATHAIEIVLEPVIAAATSAFLAHLDAVSIEDLCGRARRAAHPDAATTADYTI